MTKPTSDAMVTGLSILGVTALVCAFVAARRRSWVGVTAGTAISMAITLLVWQRYDQIWKSVGPRR